MVDRNEFAAWLSQHPKQVIPVQDILNHLNRSDTHRIMMTKKNVKTKTYPPSNVRCNAYIRGENKPRCSRHRKDDHLFCGTHLNHQPYGAITEHETSEPVTEENTVNVWPHELNGIMYFVDKYQNVYNTVDVLRQKQGSGVNADVIGVYFENSLQLF